MRVGIIQPSFVPWRGYFDFIASVDIFIFLDDVQYTTRDWRNRNRIKTPQGLQWLTVPVRHRSRGQLISETEIDDSRDWLAAHRRAWGASYGRTPYFEDASRLLFGRGDAAPATISALDIDLTRRICEYLQIRTPLVLSSGLGAPGSATAKLIGLVQRVGGTTYLSGPSADAYLDKRALVAAGLALEYKSYDYEPYPQAWGGFEGGVTVLDLIANCGPDSTARLRSRTADRKVPLG